LQGNADILKQLASTMVDFVYPREVEEVLLTFPGVHEVSVIGRPHRDWGEDVVAFVVPVPGTTLDPADLDRHCLDMIARFKRPKAFETELPKNNYGKVLKTERRARLAGFAKPEEQYLEGRTALVTGSTQGIGLAIGQALAAAGARIGVHGLADSRFFDADMRFTGTEASGEPTWLPGYPDHELHQIRELGQATASAAARSQRGVQN
jgi:hypothetical protein